MISLTFFGGASEIGGNKILLEYGGARVYLDFGEDFFDGYLLGNSIPYDKCNFHFINNLA